MPDERHQIAIRQLADQLRVVAQDIAPEQHLGAISLQLRDDRQQEVEVDAAAPQRFDVLLASAFAELERLVEVDVDAAAGEVRAQLAVQAEHELATGRIGIERRRLPLLAPARGPALRRLGEMVVGVETQPALHVAAAVLIRRQLDAARAAQRVEPAHIVRRERRRVAPHRLVRRVREGVLGVELQVVDAQQRQQIDDALERGACRHPVAADVEQVAAHREVGPVADAQTRQLVAVGIAQVAQCRHAVVLAGGVGGGEVDLVLGDRELVALRRQVAVVLAA